MATAEIAAASNFFIIQSPLNRNNIFTLNKFRGYVKLIVIIRLNIKDNKL